MGALLGEVEEDDRLLELHRAGDLDAFAELYERYHPQLLRFCQRRVRDRHLAEEIAQETFARAFVASRRLEDGSRFYQWLTVIATNAAIDHFRRYNRVQVVADLDLTVEMPVDAQLIRQEESATVQAAMQRVRVRHRDVLRWREDEGLTYEQIAERLGVPLSTIPPLLHRARLALRREYVAMTSGEQLLVLPGFAGPLLFARRLRDRLAQYATWLPDANAFCAPAACIAIALSSVMVPTDAAGRSIAGDDSSGPTPGVLPISGRTDMATSPASLSGEVSPPSFVPPSEASGTLVQRAAPTVVLGDGEARRRGQERARNSPYFTEIGPVGLGPDPEGDAAYLRDLITESGASS